MYYSKVEIAGVNTAKLKNLTSEEKQQLLERASKGDKAARQELIDGNLRLVLSIVQRFSNRNENADDLFQVGCIGLIKAIDNFNIELDVQFSTYAVPMIIGEVKRYLRDNNSIRVSRSVKDLAYKALQAKEELSKKLSREPSVEEITAKLNESGEEHGKEEVLYAMEAIMEPMSLYEPVYNDGSSGDALFVVDQLKDEKNTDESWLEDIAIKEAMKRLGERERSIINKRFFNGKTQMEIAEEIGISQAQVSRLEKGALAKIRKFL
ncbi:MAG: RNA polymerase sporulation sigma factor SigG [Ruminococcaceae bacterium]|nr:RNA polymerase sporulation sigma factor SigG [Oscillospiraceae bacterium]